MSIQLRKIWWLKNKKIMLAIAVVVLALITFGTYRIFHPDALAPHAESTIVTHSTDTPDETKPDEGYEWKGASDDPKYITLPTIETEGYIQNVGVDQNQEIAVPDNIHIGGWFIDSVRPGEKGLSIIDGHLNGRENDGIFINLQSIKKDDTFTVEFGNSSTKTFRVISSVTVDTKVAASVLFSQNPEVDNQLNLITCGGNFDPNSRLYDKRVIVYSELVNL